MQNQGNSLITFDTQLKTALLCLTSNHMLFRYNDYKHDPLARCNCTPPYSGENAISSRSDLNPADGKYPFGALGHRKHGGTDAKVIYFDIVV